MSGSKKVRLLDEFGRKLSEFSENQLFWQEVIRERIDVGVGCMRVRREDGVLVSYGRGVSVEGTF